MTTGFGRVGHRLSRLGRPGRGDEAFGRSRGLVMPMVLVLLLIVTLIVVAQLRRGLVDERFAGALRTNTVSDTAAQTVLRWCELRMSVAPETTVQVPAPATAQLAAWRDPNNWVAARTLAFPGADLPGITTSQCLIERADDELVGSLSDTGLAIDPTGMSRWLKFRITARVLREAGGFDHAQSELRLYLN